MKGSSVAASLMVLYLITPELAYTWFYEKSSFDKIS